MQALWIGLIAFFAVVCVLRLLVWTHTGNGETRVNRVGDRLRRMRENMRKYAVMTETLLRETPDEALLEAVLSNLWAKMRDDLSDADEVLVALSEERRRVFALYAVTGGVGQAGLAETLAGGDAALVPVCADALDAIGAARSAEALRAGMAAEDPDGYSDAYTEAFEAEAGKERMVAYIRANSAAFCDKTA